MFSWKLNVNLKIKFDAHSDTFCVLFDMRPLYDVNTFQSVTQYTSGIDKDLVYLRNKIIYIVILIEYLIIACGEKMEFPGYLWVFRQGYNSQDSSACNFVCECAGSRAFYSVELANEMLVV
jgi:hypothetical protein